MRWKLVGFIVGVLVICIGFGMLIPVCFSLYYHDNGIEALIESMLVSVLLGILMVLFGKEQWSGPSMSHRRGWRPPRWAGWGGRRLRGIALLPERSPDDTGGLHFRSHLRVHHHGGLRHP